MNANVTYLTDLSGKVISPVTSVDSIYSKEGISLLDLFYPIGSYYETSDNTFDPNVVWGGEWTYLDSIGYVTAAGYLDEDEESNNTSDSGVSGYVSETTGEATHTLTTSEMPSHTHTFTGTSHTHTFSGSSHTHSFSATTGSKSLTGRIWNMATQSSNYGVSASGVFSMNSLSSGSVGYADSHQTITGSPSDDVAFDASHTHSVSGTTGSTTAGGSNSSTTAGGTNSSTGSGNAHNIVQPTLFVIRWHRVG